jgi:hypothetical protein
VSAEWRLGGIVCERGINTAVRLAGTIDFTYITYGFTFASNMLNGKYNEFSKTNS